MAPSDLSLAIASYEWQKAFDVVKSQPGLARVWSVRFGFFEGQKESTLVPLHEACFGGAPIGVAQAILEAYPEASQSAETAYKRLPLHCACRRNADPAVVKLLLNAYSRACVIPDSLGRLPLHYALSNGADHQVVHLLLDANPDSTRGVDDKGWTPLHVACSVGASSSVVARLLELNPEAVFYCTERGSSPSDLVLQQAANSLEVKAMIQQTRQDFEREFVSPLNSGVRSVDDLILV